MSLSTKTMQNPESNYSLAYPISRCNLKIRYNSFNYRYIYYDYSGVKLNSTIKLQYRSPSIYLDGLYFLLPTKSIEIKHNNLQDNKSCEIIMDITKPDINMLQFIEILDAIQINIDINIKKIINLPQFSFLKKKLDDGTNSGTNSNPIKNLKNKTNLQICQLFQKKAIVADTDIPNITQYLSIKVNNTNGLFETTNNDDISYYIKIDNILITNNMNTFTPQISLCYSI